MGNINGRLPQVTPQTIKSPASQLKLDPKKSVEGNLQSVPGQLRTNDSLDFSRVGEIRMNGNSGSVQFQRSVPEVRTPDTPAIPERREPGAVRTSVAPLAPTTTTTINTLNPQGNMPGAGSPEDENEQMTGFRQLSNGGLQVDMTDGAGQNDTFNFTTGQVNHLFSGGPKWITSDRKDSGAFTYMATPGLTQQGAPTVSNSSSTSRVDLPGGGNRTIRDDRTTTSTNYKGTVGVEANYGQLGGVNKEQFLRDPRSATRIETPQNGDYTGIANINAADPDRFRANPEAYYNDPNSKWVMNDVDKYGQQGDSIDVTAQMQQLTPEQRKQAAQVYDGSFDADVTRNNTTGNRTTTDQDPDKVIPGKPGVPGKTLPAEKQNLTYSVLQRNVFTQDREQKSRKLATIPTIDTRAITHEIGNAPASVRGDLTNKQPFERKIVGNQPGATIVTANPIEQEGTINGVRTNKPVPEGTAVPLKTTKTPDKNNIDMGKESVGEPTTASNGAIFWDPNPDDTSTNSYAIPADAAAKAGMLDKEGNFKPNGEFGSMIRNSNRKPEELAAGMKKFFGEGVTEVPLDIPAANNGKRAEGSQTLKPIQLADRVVDLPGLPGKVGMFSYTDGDGDGKRDLYVPKEGADPAALARFIDTRKKNPNDRAVPMDLFRRATAEELSLAKDVTDNFAGQGNPSATGFTGRVDANGNQVNLRKAGTPVQGRQSAADPLP
jgi:hypothetical protein